MQRPIRPKLHIFDKSPGLKTSKGQYSVIIIAPPFGNRICHALYNSNILCSICTKLHMFDKCAGLNTSTCQYPVIVIAPPAGSRKFGRYKWLWHIPPVFLTWNAYCSPFIDFLKPPLAVSPGASARSSLLAALIRAQASKAQGPLVLLRIIIFFLFLFFSFNRPGVFRGLNVLKNSWKFAHTLESAAIRTPQRLGPGRGTGALRRPLEHSLKTWCIAHTYLHVFIWNSVHI